MKIIKTKDKLTKIFKDVEVGSVFMNVYGNPLLKIEEIDCLFNGHEWSGNVVDLTTYEINHFNDDMEVIEPKKATLNIEVYENFFEKGEK